MDIISALKTGQNLRRPISKYLGCTDDGGWVSNEWIKEILLAGSRSRYYSGFETNHPIDEEDLLADDWQAEPKKVLVSATDIVTALDRAVKSKSPIWYLPISALDIARELGLLEDDK